MRSATPVHCTVSLRIVGDDLVPADVTGAMGHAPTDAWTKGTHRVGRVTGREFRKRTGAWLLNSELPRTSPLETQIQAILGKVTADGVVWGQLHARYSTDLFCGVFIDTGNINQMLDLTPDVLRKIADRHLTLTIDLYGSEQPTSEREIAVDDQTPTEGEACNHLREQKTN